VSVHQVALSDKKGLGYLRLPKDTHWGLATLGGNPVRFKKYDEREVELISLDGFAEENHITQVDFIKIDTEGWELHVLEGGKELIRKNKPIMLIEWNKENMKQCHVVEEDLIKFLDEMGYKWDSVSQDDILCVPKVL
jgi:FkbM family methyltransferase